MLQGFCAGTGANALQWRYNERDGVSSHRCLDFLLNRLLRRRSKKISKLCVTGFCEGFYRWPVSSPHKGSVMRKTFPTYPAHAQPTNLHIWQEAHSNKYDSANTTRNAILLAYSDRNRWQSVTIAEFDSWFQASRRCIKTLKCWSRYWLALILTFHRRCPVAFAWGQLHKKY